MKITIEVDDNLFLGEITDSFQDFFGRVVSDISSNVNDHRGLSGNYELETAKMLKSAFENGTYEKPRMIDNKTDDLIFFFFFGGRK